MKITFALEQSITFPITEGLRKQTWLHAQKLKTENPKLDIEIRCIGKKNTTFINGIKIKTVPNWKFPFFKTNILHYFGTPSPFTFLLLKISKFKSFYITMTDGELGKFWTSRWSKLSIKPMNKQSSLIILQTRYQKKLADPFFSVPIKIAPPIIEKQTYTNIKTPYPSLLYMSHLNPIKGILTILESFETLSKTIPNILLTIANSGLHKNESPILQRIKTLQENGLNIQLKGAVSPSEELSKHWIYLYPIELPHNTFSIPISLFEAFQCHTVPISSNIGGIPEYINKQLLIEPKSPKSLVKKIHFWIQKYQNLSPDWFKKQELNEPKNIGQFYE